MLSELLNEKKMLGQELDERLKQQKADSASLETRMNAIEKSSGSYVSPNSGTAEQAAELEEGAAEMEAMLEEEEEKRQSMLGALAELAKEKEKLTALLAEEQALQKSLREKEQEMEMAATQGP